MRTSVICAARRRCGRLALLALAGSLALTAPGRAMDYKESPYLAAKVAAGELPPVAERLPETPSVARFDREDMSIGQYGGDLHMMRARAKDVRHMVVFGYARLVAYDEEYELTPDIVERFEVNDGREFTFHLRRGHKWSDGHPFTSEDFRYFWQDVASNEEISPFGPDNRLIVNGEPPKVEILDRHTVRYSWSQPNPYFLPALAGATPLYIYRPAHYLKQFHVRYRDPAELAKLVEETGQRNWAALHHRMDRQYRNDNTDLPSLQPWVNITLAPSERFVFVRNPYYYRVDPEGRQLPYIDQVTMPIVAGSIIPTKTGAGDADLQARDIRFDNYTFLRKAAKRNGYDVRLWQTAKGSHVALYPNLNVNDDGWRALFRDVRFRRALSLAINRHEINQAVYFGLGLEVGNAPLPRSPLARPEYSNAWAAYDPALANRLLDEIGLDKRNDNGIRLMPDGRPLHIIVETAGESTEQTDVLELVRDTWIEVGIKLFSKPSQREVFRNRIFAGETLMSVWAGLENGLPTADMSPEELAPTSQQQLQWPKWGQYFQSGGQAGEAPDMAIPKQLMALEQDWRRSRDRAQREEIWHRMLPIFTDQVFTIGIVSGVLQPVVVNDRLMNVPQEGVYNWDPGAFFGMYKPDTFWFVDGTDRRSKEAASATGASPDQARATDKQ